MLSRHMWQMVWHAGRLRTAALALGKHVIIEVCYVCKGVQGFHYMEQMVWLAGRPRTAACTCCGQQSLDQKKERRNFKAVQALGITGRAPELNPQFGGEKERKISTVEECAKECEEKGNFGSVQGLDITGGALELNLFRPDKGKK
eukprot:1158876-Pelagomonas_calceolata.AAC.5